MRLVSAEVLKLVRRRGLMIWSLLLTVGAVLVAEIIIIALHAANPAHHGAAGGRTNLENYTFLLAGLGNVAAIIIGATAGTQDVANGVFRDLVVTAGRARPCSRAGARARCSSSCRCSPRASSSRSAVTYAFAGDKPTPSASYVVHSIAYAVSITVVDVILAIGLAAFASSRVVVGVLIAWNAIVSHLLLAIGALGSARKLIDVAASEHFSPAINDNNQIGMSGDDRPARADRLGGCRDVLRALVDPAHRRLTTPRTRRGRSCEPARSSSAPRRCRRARSGRSRARSRGARCPAPSARSARRGGSTCPPR